MHAGACALIVTYRTMEFNVDRLVNLMLNDQPLPARIEESYPERLGMVWPAGSRITFTFGEIAREDYERFAAADGLPGTLTVWGGERYVRPKGIVSFDPDIPEISLLLTADCRTMPNVSSQLFP